jgi:hypothetical protein
LKKFIAVFQQLALRALTVGVNAFQKLRCFGWSFLIREFGVVNFLKKQFVKFASRSWKVLRSRAFLINLLIALFIELLLIAAPYHKHEIFPNWAEPVASHLQSSICKKEDAYIDWVMKMYGGTELKEEQEQQKAHAFVWLDIDKYTYKEWNKPPYTPRDKLLELIQFSVEHGAKIVIVDINLTHTTGPGGKELSNEDKALRDYFKNYSQEPVHPPIILAGTFDVKNHKTNAGGDDQSKSCVEKSPFFLDDVVVVVTDIYWAAPTFYNKNEALWDYFQRYSQEPGHPLIIPAGTFGDDQSKSCVEKSHSFLDDDDVVTDNIYWAAPTFYKEAGGIIRRLQLWEGPGKEGQVFPSIPLLTGALIRKPKGLIKKDCDLHHFTPDCLCSKCAVDWQDDDILWRIIYRMPWKLEKDETYPTIEFNGETSDLLKVISVRKVHDYEEDIKDRIVMIGGSYDDPQDFHETPLGRMPGALIILNAIHSLFLGKIQPLCGWQKFSILTLFVFITSLCFTVFGTFKGMCISWVVVLSLLVTLMFLMGDSLFLFRPGVLFDFAIPLTIIDFLNSLPLRKFVSGPRED